MRSGPGAKAQALGEPVAMNNRTPTPAMVMRNPARMRSVAPAVSRGARPPTTRSAGRPWPGPGVRCHQRAGGVGAATGPKIGGLITSAISRRASFVFQTLVIAAIVRLSRRVEAPLPADPTRRTPCPCVVARAVVDLAPARSQVGQSVGEINRRIVVGTPKSHQTRGRRRDEWTTWSRGCATLCATRMWSRADPTLFDSGASNPEMTSCLSILLGAPGRIRTCDARFRKPTLYPLSYEGGAWRKPSRKASQFPKWVFAMPERG
jgi:hypothetical protein